MRRFATMTLITMLALISTWYVYKVVILPNIDIRITIANDILSGQMEPPYQYRVFKPLVGRILETLLTPLTTNIQQRHAISYVFMTFATFMGTFSVFYLYLRRFYSHNASIIGLLFLQVTIPLSVTGEYMEGDFITLGFYALGLYLIVIGKDIYLPVMIGFAAINREQSAFLVFLYAIYLFSQRQVSRQKLSILFACFIVWFIAFMGTRLYFGFKPSQYTMSLHIAHNTDIPMLLTSIIPLWIVEVASSAVLCVLAFPRSNLFFRLSFLSLSVYVLLFFLNGNMWELAKFLPAFLVTIPMSLQVLTGEFVEKLPDPSSQTAAV